MKFAVAKEHRAFYALHGWVEFEGLVKPEDLEKINTLLDRKFQDVPSRQEQYLHGHDLWREAEEVRRLCCKRAHAEIASDLFGLSALRLGCDQLIPGGWILEKSTASPLNQRVSFQDAAGGLMITLRGGFDGDKGKLPNPITPYPSTPGSGVFFPTDVPLKLSTGAMAPEDRYLLIVYTPQHCLYVHRQEDLHTHALKEVGYNFGDHLDQDRNPLVLR